MRRAALQCAIGAAIALVGWTQGCGSDVRDGEGGAADGTSTETSSGTGTGMGTDTGTGTGTGECESDPPCHQFGCDVTCLETVPDPFCQFGELCGNPTATSTEGDFCWEVECADLIADGECPPFDRYRDNFTPGTWLNCDNVDEGPYLSSDGSECCYLHAVPETNTGTGTSTSTGTGTGTGT